MTLVVYRDEEAAKKLETYGQFVSELVLKSCGFTADQFERLFQHLTSAMTTIDLRFCTNITDTAKDALRNKGIQVHG